MSDSMLERMQAFLNSPEGEKSLREFAAKIEREAVQAKKWGDYLSTLTYEQRLELFQRVDAKHDERWRELCYSRGYEPYPWNIVHPVFKAAELYGEDYDYDKEGPLDSFDEHFGAFTKLYLGFYFNWIFGQGTVLRVFDKDKQEIFRY